MIFGKTTEFCDSTSAILAAGATGAIIGNVINLQADSVGTGTASGSSSNTGNVLCGLGVGTPLYWVVQVDTTFVGATSTTTFQLASDSTSDLATSRTNHLSTGAIPVATLVAGYTVVIPLPMDFTFEKYLGVWETVATANVTAGAISSFITDNARLYRAYADAVN